MNIANTRIMLLDSVQFPVQFSYFFGHEPFISRKPPEAGKTNRPQYKTQLIIGKDHPQVPEIMAAIQEAAKQFWREKWQDMLVAAKDKGKIPILRGETRNPGDDNSRGKLVVTANAKGRFTITETRGGVNVPLTAADGRPYSGAYGNAIFNVYGYKKDGGEGITAGLEGVQFTRHGKAFGGGAVAAPNEFPLVNVADSADAAAPAGVPDDMDNLLGL